MEDVNELWSYIDESPEGLENPNADEERYAMDLVLRAGKILRQNETLSEAVEFLLVRHPISFLVRPAVMMLVRALREQTLRFVATGVAD